MVDENVDNLPDIHFVWIPKTAGTSVWTHFQALGGWRVGCNVNVEEYRRRWTVGFIRCLLTKPWAYASEFPQRGIVTYNHLSLWRLYNKCEVDEAYLRRAYTFTIVRHPYDRLVSLAADKASGRVRKGAPHATTENMLQEIVQRMADGEIGPIGRWSSRAYSQTNPQVTWIDDARKVGAHPRILRYENLQEDMDAACGTFGIEPFHVPHLNRSDHGRPRDYFTSTMLHTVRRFYRRDFKRLRYVP